MKWILMVAVVVAVQTAVTRSYRSSLKREPHEVNGYMIGPGADLRRADLFGADLEGVDLSGADLNEANLYEADLGGALLSGVNLIGARANKNTTWPDGFDPVAAGVTFE
ncbi:MAG: pentapeptide repeat-containing protein [Acidimicrobiales bacterium]|nr:pentapeptide repeat-containing protein [Acidimicrobiales bacterium]